MNKVLLIISLSLVHFSSMAQQARIDGDVSMLALGDSYTIGQSVDSSGRWPHQLIDELRILGVSAMYPDYIATTGWTTNRLIQAMNDMIDDEKSYNLVSILIGVNNQYQGISIATYEPDLRTIIDRALNVVDQDRSRIFILSIPDYAYTRFGGGNANISEEIDAYNDIKRRVAGEYGIAFIDITPISREGLSNTTLVASDGLHPSELQYRRWVEAIMPRLQIIQPLSSAALPGIAEADIQVYPNPARSIVHIDADADISRISIYNNTGSLVSDEMISTRSKTIDLSNLEPGIFTLRIHFENGEKIFRRILLFQ
ncbi:MAG: GDSL-type esterase/lipase family protein [Bacteroides sp.]|nr:GDSL-type esterase/lipase family protein [Bacteroides sp.]